MGEWLLSWVTPLNVHLSEEEKEKLRGRGLYRRD